MLLESDWAPARLAAGDILELTAVERCTSDQKVDLSRRIAPAVWDAGRADKSALQGLDATGRGAPSDDKPIERSLIFHQNVSVG